MAKFKHTQGLASIEFEKTITVWCPLGNDYYTATIGVYFRPGEYLMDYLDEEDYFKELSGEKLIIEDLLAKVFDHYMKTYEPKELTITVNATNATHFPVKVCKYFY